MVRCSARRRQGLWCAAAGRGGARGAPLDVDDRAAAGDAEAVHAPAAADAAAVGVLADGVVSVGIAGELCIKAEQTRRQPPPGEVARLTTKRAANFFTDENNTIHRRFHGDERDKAGWQFWNVKNGIRRRYFPRLHFCLQG